MHSYKQRAPLMDAYAPAKFTSTFITSLYSFQKCRCFYCNKFMRYVSYHPKHPVRKFGYTVDHFFPRSLGFKLEGNAVLCCRQCNENKANRIPTYKEVSKALALYRALGKKFVATTG